MLAVPVGGPAQLRAHGLFDDRVRFLPGWFRDTLPTVADRTWSVVRLDGDYYESTMDGLVNLYRLSVGGFLIVDDFSIDACRQAVEDYRAEHGIRSRSRLWTGHACTGGASDGTFGAIGVRVAALRSRRVRGRSFHRGAVAQEPRR
jgi:hypothetical protein